MGGALAPLRHIPGRPQRRCYSFGRVDPRPLVLVSGKDPVGQAGGHTSYIRAHALAAARCGFDPHVFCAANTLRPRTTRADFATIHHVPVPGRHNPVVLQNAPLARAVVHFLEDVPGPHLIHGFGLWSGAATSASRALNMGGAAAVPVASAYATRLYEIAAMQPGIRSHHGLALKLHYAVRLRWTRWVEDLVEGRGYARSKLVLVNYDSVERILEDAYGPRLNIRRVPYASEDAFEEDDDDRTEARPAPGAPARILSVSRHDPRKGVDVLLLALGCLAAEGVDFSATLVGPGRLLHAHRRLAADLGLAERVSIPGRVDDVAPYFERADVFVLPSLAEASGSMSVLEALRAGIAIVASACDGVPEDLTDGVDAMLVEPGDPSALAGALRTLLADSARRGQLAANGRRTHDQRFSADRFVAAIRDVYCELERSAATAARTPSAT